MLRWQEREDSPNIHLMPLTILPENVADASWIYLLKFTIGIF